MKITEKSGVNQTYAEKEEVYQKNGYHRSFRPDRRERKKAEEEKEVKGVVKASDLHLFQKENAETVLEKAKKKSMQVLLSQFAEDEMTNELMNSLADKNVEKEAEAVKCHGEILSLEEREQQVQNMHGVDPDSKEQKELDILVKQADGERLTEEEKEVLADMGPLTKYQEDYLNVHERKNQLKAQEQKAKDEAYASRFYLNSIKKELLKEHGMVDASKEAEDIMKEGRKAAIGQLLEEAKETLEEKAEEAKEKQEAMQERQEKLEELREKGKPEQEETLEETMENTLELSQIRQKLLNNLINGNQPEIELELDETQKERLKGIKIDDLI